VRRPRTIPFLLALFVLGVGADHVAGQSGWRIGPRVGLTVSVMQFEDPATAGQTEALFGFVAGVAVQREMTRHVTAEFDVVWSREGFRGEGAHTGNLIMDYIAVPVMLRLRTPTRVSVHVAMGGSGRLGLRCRQTEVPVARNLSCDDPLMGADWSRLDVAGVVGAGVTLPAAGRRLSTDALLSWGLRDLNRGLHIPGSARSLSLQLTFALLSPPDGSGGGR